MNRRAMTNAFHSFAVLALLLSGCGNPSAPDEKPPLAEARIGGPFTLIDSKGLERHWSDWGGRYRLVYFGYTYCPAICPTDVLWNMQGYDSFKLSNPALAAQVQPIFITIDPERDTPERVGEFTAAFSDDLIGLTGTQEQVDVAIRAFGVYAQKGEVYADGGYDMDHTRATYLMGRNGEPIALIPTQDGPEAVAAELARWVH